MQMNAYRSTRIMMEGVKAIDGLEILGTPDATLFAIASEKYDVHSIADEMSENGWYINRQQLPPSLHIFVTDIHVGKEQMFIDDLKDAVKKAGSLRKVLSPSYFNKLMDMAGKGGESGGNRKAAMYGMMGALKGSDKLEEIVEDFIDQLNSPEPTSK